MSDQPILSQVEECERCAWLKQYIRWAADDGRAWDLLELERKLNEHIRERHTKTTKESSTSIPSSAE